jgi:hypothetical protein
MDTPMQKLSVSLCPNSAADSTAVNSVAIVDEYLQRSHGEVRHGGHQED